jgi:hypothetical protein
MKTQKENLPPSVPVRQHPGASAEAPSADFKELIELLSLVSQASNKLGTMEAATNKEVFEMLEAKMPEFTLLQGTLTEAENKIKEICIKNPGWFSVKKTLATPYGSVKSHSSTVLETENEDVSIVLLEREAEINKEFKPADFLRQQKKLNLESLERLTDAELARFRIKRVPKETINVKPAKLDMGKAVEEAIKAEAA